jgi:hypothetical protein
MFQPDIGPGTYSKRSLTVIVPEVPVRNWLQHHAVLLNHVNMKLRPTEP